MLRSRLAGVVNLTGPSATGWPRVAYATFALLPLAVTRRVVRGIDKNEALPGLGCRRKRVTLDRGNLLARLSASRPNHRILARSRGGLPWLKWLFSHNGLFLTREE